MTVGGARRGASVCVGDNGSRLDLLTVVICVRSTVQCRVYLTRSEHSQQVLNNVAQHKHIEQGTHEWK